MRIVQGDLLEVKQGLICHQVNCKRVAGAGLALQIRKRWPKWHQDFLATQPQLGLVTYYEVEPGLFVANFYAQYDYGRGKRYTRYPDFRCCLRQAAQFAHLHDVEVYLPYGIGCGLAGGDRPVIRVMIAQELPHAILIKKIEHGLLYTP